jgi:enhancing lycopene biosynthesis protein 2
MKNFFLTLVLLLNGCGVITEQSIYEGVRTQQKIKDVGAEPKSQPMPSYEQYKEEREKGRGQSGEQ